MTNRYYQGPPSDHFDGERFFNPGVESTDKSLTDIRRWRRTGVRAKWTRGVPQVSQARPQARCEEIVVTMVGHASLLIQVAQRNILVDPVWSQRASPFSFVGPARWDAPGIAREDLPPIDAVLISHNHYDHMDLATLGWLHADHAAQFVVPLGNDAIVRRVVPTARLSAADWHETIDLGGGMQAVVWPAYHWSARWLRDRRMALWCGFVLTTPRGVIYVVGDTAYGDGAPFRAVRARFGAPTVAVIPIGAYEPRWFMRTQHIDPPEAVQIALDCGTDHAIGSHWGTFQLTDEAREEPPRRLAAAAEAAGLHQRFVALRPGQAWSARPPITRNASPG